MTDGLQKSAAKETLKCLKTGRRRCGGQATTWDACIAHLAPGSGLSHSASDRGFCRCAPWEAEVTAHVSESLPPRVGDLDWDPGFWLGSGPALVVVGIWGVPEQMEALSPFISWLLNKNKYKVDSVDSRGQGRADSHGWPAALDCIAPYNF